MRDLPADVDYIFVALRPDVMDQPTDGAEEPLFVTLVVAAAIISAAIRRLRLVELLRAE